MVGVGFGGKERIRRPRAGNVVKSDKRVKKHHIRCCMSEKNQPNNVETVQCMVERNISIGRVVNYLFLSPYIDQLKYCTLLV